MSEWKEVRLDSLVNRKICYGIVQPGISPEEGVPVIKVNNIVKGLRDVSECDKTTEVINNKYKRTILKGGELVISLVGTVGYVDIVPFSFAGANLVRATGMIDIEDELIKHWVLFYIRTKQGQQYIEEHLNTTVQRALNIKDLCKMPIPITQRCYMEKVVSILSVLNDKIAVNRRICENLEAQAQALFKHWFIDFAPFKNGKFVESELGMIPEGWRVGTLGEICKTNKRTLSSKNTPDVIEYLDTGNITANRIDNIQILHKGQDKIPSRAKRLVSEGDIIFSAVRPNQRHYGLLMNPSPSLVVSTGFVVITANWSAYRYFIYRFLVQNSIIETLQAIGEQSVSTYPSINANDIESLKLIIPKMEDVEDFADICCNFYCKIESIEQESSRLSTLRDTLLPKLMSGQIKVNEMEKSL